MAFSSVKLIPGINVERTPTLLEAGYAQSQLIRFKDGLAQKYGGWTQFYPLALAGTPRHMHAWDDLNGTGNLMVGTTQQLGVISEGQLSNITPQTLISDFAPDFSTTSGSAVVEVHDPNIANVTVYDTVFFNTPVSVGGLILAGLYPIASITGTTSYTIVASKKATATVANGGAVPAFTTTANSAVVNVKLDNHNLSPTVDTVVFSIPTTGGGVVILGSYTVNSVIDADNFTITVAATALSTATFSMNGGDAELVYYISLGPPPAGVGYGLGGCGEGGYGTGVLNPNQIGTEITAADWSLDNWGQIALSCPQDGPIYYWDPTGGFFTATMISTGPVFNRGMFVSTSQQILIAFGSSIDYGATNSGFGVQQDPMLVQWCDVGNFFEWRALSSTQAGNFRIPIGSLIVGGMAVSNQNLIWTDLDLWAMSYIGYPEVYGFNKIGSGAGLASLRAAQQFRGSVYWMGKSNFYVYNSGGASVLPCPVWDVVFQNLNMNFIQNVRAMPNTPFNEIGWLYPSQASVSGECDSYVKMNVTEPGTPWDYGLLDRTAWIDQSGLAPPLGASAGGVVFQHETTNDANGSPMVASFQTGYFLIGEGEDYPFVDQVIPDMKWGMFGQSQNAQVTFYFNVVDFPGDTPRIFGPYTVTQATKYISVRFRGRQVSITIQSSDLGSFWRLGRVRFRWSPTGRR